MLERQAHQPAALVEWHAMAGRILEGGVDDDQPRVMTPDRVRDLVEVEALRPKSQRHGHRTGRAHDVDRAEVGGFLENDAVAPPQQAARHDVHALLTAGRDDEIAGARRHPVRGKERHQRLPQLLASGGWIVAEVRAGAARQRPLQAARERGGIRHVDRGIIAGEGDDTGRARQFEQPAADAAGVD